MPLELHRCSAFIFDMDGTLTIPQHNFEAIRAALDIPPGELILEYLASLPAAEQQHKRQQLDAIEADIATQSEAADGLFELLTELNQRKRPYAVLTRNSARNAWISMRAIGAEELFTPELVVGRDEAIPKPDPAGIHLLAERMGHTANLCAMVGDYRHDLAAGTDAGCHTVHIRHSGAPDWAQLTHTTVSSLPELLTLLR